MRVAEGFGELLAAKFEVLFPHLDERQRRLLMGAEARVLGHGGIRAVARAAGVSEATVAQGVTELDSGAEPLGRVRRPGGGRKRAADLDPGLRPALLALVEPDARGDPMSPLRWTTKSTRKLAGELTRPGTPGLRGHGGDLLREEGFSLQANAKTIEGTPHPDRDAQFRYINEQAAAHRPPAQPVISVDTKKKELVGDYAQRRPGVAARRASRSQVERPRLPRPGAGQGRPLRDLRLAANTGWVNVGTDHDTAAFAVESIRRWWNAAGRAAYPDATRLLITADAGGSNGYRTRAWKAELAALAAETGLDDHRLPLPARHLQVEQDRAPAVLPHLHELARPAADQPRSHRPDHRRDHHPHRAHGSMPSSTPAPTRPASRSATSRWPPCRSPATACTATGTTPCIRTRARPAGPPNQGRKPPADGTAPPWPTPR